VTHAYRDVSTGTWDDGLFRQLSEPAPNAQTLWLRLLCGPETTCVPGVVRATLGGLAERMGWPIEELRRCWEELVRAEMVEADFRDGVIWLPKAPKQRQNRPASPNAGTAWGRLVATLPEGRMREAIRDAYLEAFGDAFGEGKGKAILDAFAKACGKPSAKPSAKASPKPRPKPSEKPSVTPSATPSPIQVSGPRSQDPGLRTQEIRTQSLPPPVLKLPRW